MPRIAFVLMVLVTAIGAAAQAPQIQNGRVETPAVTYYSDGMVSVVRGCRMEPGEPGESRAAWTPPDFPPPSGPVQLEAGTSLTVFVRLVDRRIERIRMLSDDCPVDAGGREVRWLTASSPSSTEHPGTAHPRTPHGAPRTAHPAPRTR